MGEKKCLIGKRKRNDRKWIEIIEIREIRIIWLRLRIRIRIGCRYE